LTRFQPQTETSDFRYQADSVARSLGPHGELDRDQVRLELVSHCIEVATETEQVPVNAVGIRRDLPACVKARVASLGT
jgi:hypothetical protein